MIRKDLRIVNKLGLHARAAAKLVTLASRYGADVQLYRNGQQVNGKSIMGVMMLAANKGSDITVEVEGEDEDRAMEAIEQLVADRFGEDE